MPTSAGSLGDGTSATSAKQDTGNTSLASLDTKQPTIGQKGLATSSPVVSPSEQTNGQPIAAVSTLMAGLDPSGLQRPFALDPTGYIITQPLSRLNTDFVFGDVSVSTIARVPVTRTTYTEQTANAQRSIASASALDTAAGTGARTLKIVYFDSVGAGPFSETLTLNGITGVNTVATNICFIEYIEVLTAGSTGLNQGVISLYTAINKGGTVIGSIGVGENQTSWCHHYVATGKTCYISGISCSHSGTTVGSGALFTLNAKKVTVSGAVDTQVSDFIRLYGQSSTFQRPYQSPIKVEGPARIRAFVTPESATAVIYRASIDFYEN